MTDDPFERAVRRAEAAERRDQVDHLSRKLATPWSRLAVKGFRIHLFVYLAVNALLLVIWATTFTGVAWPLYVIFGWGIGLLAHYAAVKDHVDRARRSSRGRDD